MTSQKPGIINRQRSDIVKFEMGLSLIELLISMALGLVLMAGILQIFSASKRMFELTDDLSVIQEKGQLAIALLSENIRMADYWGGIESNAVQFGQTFLSVSPGECSSQWLFKSDPALIGFEGSSSISGISTLPSACIENSDYVPHSDLLLVRYAGSKRSISDAKIDNAKYKNRYFVRSELGSLAYVFLGGNSKDALLKIPASPFANNMEFHADLFFLRPCSHKRKGSCQDQLPTLMRLTLSGNRFVQQALIDGVEQLQFDYGVDTSGNRKVDNYISSPSINQWKDVISVQVTLVIRSTEADSSIDELDKVYELLGGDNEVLFHHVISEENRRYHRKVYRREVVIRNRIINKDLDLEK